MKEKKILEKSKGLREKRGEDCLDHGPKATTQRRISFLLKKNRKSISRHAGGGVLKNKKGEKTTIVLSFPGYPSGRLHKEREKLEEKIKKNENSG